MEVGSHGLRHVSLTSVPGPGLTAEVENSRVVLQGVSGQPVTGFCYPYGHVGGREVAGVRVAGYDYGCAIWRSGLGDGTAGAAGRAQAGRDAGAGESASADDGLHRRAVAAPG